MLKKLNITTNENASPINKEAWTNINPKDLFFSFIASKINAIIASIDTDKIGDANSISFIILIP